MPAEKPERTLKSRQGRRSAAAVARRLESFKKRRCNRRQLVRRSRTNLVEAQVGDAPERRAITPALVKRSYERRLKIFCLRVNTNIATYNIRTLKAKWRQQELVSFLEMKRILRYVQSKNTVSVTLSAETQVLTIEFHICSVDGC